MEKQVARTKATFRTGIPYIFPYFGEKEAF